MSAENKNPESIDRFKYLCINNCGENIDSIIIFMI